MIITIFLAMTIVWHIPVAAATSLEEIKVSHEISAPIDQVWNITSPDFSPPYTYDLFL
jgi:hypothetical protein